jgi:phosphohistidine phosphatase
VKTLYLLRHAEAEKRVLLEDLERKLTEAGRNQVIDLAKKIKKQSINFDIALCSISQRTIETCDALLENSAPKTPVERRASLYNPSIEDLISNIEMLDNNVNSALIVSHNPAISELRNLLSSEESGLTYFNPADMEILKLDIDTWQHVKANCARASKV